MSKDNNKTGSELDKIIEKLGLEEVEQNQENENLIDLNIVEEELKNKKFKTKKVKKLNLSIIIGGALILIMAVFIIALKSCQAEGAGIIKNGTTNIFNGQGTTAGDVDRPNNVTKPNITNSEETSSTEETTTVDPDATTTVDPDATTTVEPDTTTTEATVTP